MGKGREEVGGLRAGPHQGCFILSLCLSYLLQGKLPER